MESCSAPGNKTLQLQKYFPKNYVVSYEFNEARSKVLQKRVKFHRQKEYSEFLLIEDNFFNSTKLENKDKVKMVVCDPSCSGSGMLNKFEERDKLTKAPKSKIFSLLCIIRIIRIMTFHFFVIEKFSFKTNMSFIGIIELTGR